MHTTTIAVGLIGLALAGCGWRDHEEHHRFVWGAHRAGVCDERHAGRHLDRAVGRAERYLDITDEQRPAWNHLVAEVGSAVHDACAAARPDDEPADALAAFARLERVASASAAGLERIRPAVEAFYAVLDEEQRQDLDRILTRRRFG